MILDAVKAVRVEDEIARRGGLGLKRFGSELIGPCVKCGGRDRFAVSIKRQVFNCRGCGASGDVIALVQHLDQCTFPAAVKTLGGAERKSIPIPIVKPQVQKTEDDARNGRLALKLWDDASEIRGTIAETYLERRGLVPPEGDDDVLRFYGGCPFGDSRHSCMLALYRSIATNEPRAICRTALGPNGIKIGRLTLGPTRGAAIKVDDDASVSNALTIGEGLETVLAGRILGFRPAWATGSSAGVKNFPVLSGIEALTVLVDRDPPDANGRQAGQEAALACSERWTAAGREVRRVVPKTMGADMADLIGGNSGQSRG